MQEKSYLVATLDALLLVDEDAKIIRTLQLAEEAGSRVQQLRSLDEGRPIPGMDGLLQGLPADVLVVEKEGLGKAAAAAGWKGAVEVEFPSLGGRAIRRRPSLSSSQRSWETARELASEKTRESYEEWDHLVIQAVGAIDELDRSMANLYARCREWYSIHFPELERIVKSEEEYSRIILCSDPRSAQVPEELGLSQERARRIREAANKSIGIALGEDDLDGVRELARSILYLGERKSKLVSYLSDVMERRAPSLSKVAEPGTGARLIARAGSIHKLAMMPSTSVQTLGAEKALFRHITKGARPPKHGIIFQHPYVRNSPKELRGKIAGILASKISLAARTDYITGESKADELKASLDAAVEKLRSRRK